MFEVNNSYSQYFAVNEKNRLYIVIHDLKKSERMLNNEINDIISKISCDTLPIEFEAICEKYPNYKLEMKGARGTGLYESVSFNNVDLTKFFLKRLSKENINRRIFSDNTVLMSAVTNLVFKHGILKQKTYEIIRELLLAEADVNIGFFVGFDGFHNTVLTKALENKDVKLAKLLMEFGAKKLYAISPNGKCLIKQKFTKEENEIYEQAKKELNIKGIKKKKRLFLLGSIDFKSIISCLPKEVIGEIISRGEPVSSNQKRVYEAKKMIACNNF